MEHKLRVERRVLWHPNNDDLIALGVRSDTLKVDFDAEWEAMDHIYVHFYNGTRSHRSILDGDTVTVPWEVTLDPGDMFVTFVGYVGLEKRIVTEQMERPYFVNPAGPVDLESPHTKSPDDIQYFLDIARRAQEEERIRAIAEQQRQTNEAVRIANEERRLLAEQLDAAHIARIALAIQTLGHLHADVPYLYLVDALHIGDGLVVESDDGELMLSDGVYDADAASIRVGGGFVGVP